MVLFFSQKGQNKGSMSFVVLLLTLFISKYRGLLLKKMIKRLLEIVFNQFPALDGLIEDDLVAKLVLSHRSNTVWVL